MPAPKRTFDNIPLWANCKLFFDHCPVTNSYVLQPATRIVAWGSWIDAHSLRFSVRR
jgi:hypothetical protein